LAFSYFLLLPPKLLEGMLRGREGGGDGRDGAGADGLGEALGAGAGAAGRDANPVALIFCPGFWLTWNCDCERPVPVNCGGACGAGVRGDGAALGAWRC